MSTYEVDDTDECEHEQHPFRRVSNLLTKVVAILFVVAAAWVVLTTFYNYVAEPYIQFRQQRITAVEEARYYVEDPGGLCFPDKSLLREKVKSLVKCDESRITMKSWPALDAFAMLMNHLQLCPTCVTFHVGIFGMMSWIFWAGLGGAALFIIAAATFTILACYGRMNSGYALPYRMDPVQTALWQRQHRGALRKRVGCK